MKKILLILTLISLTTHAMEVDEEAAIPLPPAGQEQHQNEGEEVLQEKKKHLCIRIGTRVNDSFCCDKVGTVIGLVLGAGAMTLVFTVLITEAFT